MELRFILDGTEYPDSIDWDKLSESLTWDYSNQVYSFSFGEEYSFQGDAYNYLYSRFTSGNQCALVSCEIWKDGRLIVVGNIFITDASFNENRRVVTVTIEDAGFSSRISNNKNIDISPIAATSKNGVAITLPDVIYTAFFDKDGISSLTGNVGGYRVHDFMQYAVAWMSDDTVDFASDFFDTGDGSGLQLTSGFNVRAHYSTNPQPPKTNFDRLFDAVRKLYNLALGFTRDPISGRFTMRIEPMAYFRDSGTSITVQAPNDIEMSFIKELLFASVKVGTNVTKQQDCNAGDTACSAFVTANYYGCDEETYGLTGECNINSQLNLSPDSQFIYDTNTIIDIFQYQNDQYDNDIVLYDTFPFALPAPATYAAKNTDPLGTDENWYNGELMNNIVLARYQDYLLGTLNLYSHVSGTGLFDADTFQTGILLPVQSPVYTTEVINPTNVVFNPQSAWSNVTNRFTAAYDGSYAFACGSGIMSWETSPIGVLISTQLVVEHYTSSGTLITRYSGPFEIYVTGDPSETYDYSTPFIDMDAGEYCIFVIDYAQAVPPGLLQAEIVYGITATGPTVHYGYFRCTDGRGLIQNIQVNTGADLAYIKRSFTIPLSDERYFAMIADPTKRVTINTAQDGFKSGWIGSVSRNFVTETATFELITNA